MGNRGVAARSSAYTLIRRLPALRGRHRRAITATLIRIDGLVHFIQTFVVLADVVSAGATSSRHLERHLMDRGVQTFAVENAAGVRCGVLLPMTGLKQALVIARPEQVG